MRMSAVLPCIAPFIQRRVFAVFLCLSVLYAPLAPAAGNAPAASDWNTFVDHYLDGYFTLNPTAGTYAGRHEFDGKLPDWSAAGIANMVAFFREESAAATAFPDATLNDQQRFERDYLLAVNDRFLFWLDTARWPFKNPQFYTDAIDPDVYLSRPYAPLKDRMRAYIAYAEALPKAAEQIRANLQTPMPKTFVKIGRIGFGGLASFFANDVPGVFAEVKDPALQAHFKKANAAAIAAMTSLDKWLEGLDATATDNFALGPDLFSEMLWKTERVQVPLDQLKRAGEADLNRNLGELKKACAQFAPGKSMKDCVSQVDGDKPAIDPVEAARKQLGDLRAFISAHDLVSIPGTEEAKVNESPPYQRWNFAYIIIPGPYEKNMPSVYYIAPPDPKWSPEERAAYIPGKYSLLYTSVHEVWPGHFLQFLHANRASSRFGQVFVGYAFAEGWAHYCEQMMWDAGLDAGNPESHIGQLLEALLRDARYLSAIGMHTEGMTVAESEKLFREKGFQDDATAREQAARGTFDPAYLNYTLGKLMIMKLRHDWTASRGGRKAWKDFHDKFLSYGGPPIPLVRSAMLGENAGPPL